MVRRSCKSSIHLPSFLSLPLHFEEPDREKAVRTLLRYYKTMPNDRTDIFLREIAEATGSGRYGPAEGETTWMNWDMIREMRKAGMGMGGHTVNHPILAHMSREQQKREIERCGQRFVEELNEPMRYFSYPIGNLRAFNDDTRSCLREVGVQFAFSYYGGYRGFLDWDDYDIRRIAVESDTSSDLFRAMITVPQVFCRMTA
jgi:hypothetical protein